MPRILVIEDEQDMQFLLCDNLQAEGYEVEAVATGKEGIGRGLSGQFNLIVLDLMLPDVNGIEVCRRIRAQDAATPIIILTARGEEIDKVVGLEVGADDYITKPFGMREFLARIRVALRRTERVARGAPKECSVGEARVDFARRRIVCGEQVQKLTRYESELLELLAANRGATVSRRRIVEEVWGREMEGGDRTVDNYVARLRAKVEPDADRPQHILTMHGTGYRLV